MTGTGMSGAGMSDAGMSETDLERRLRGIAVMSPAGHAAARTVDTAAAWRELAELRARSRAARRRGLTAACVAGAAAVAIAVPAIAVGLSGHQPGGRPSGQVTPGTRAYPGAIAASIPLSGVVAVVGDAGHAWVIRQTGQPGYRASYQLAGIDLRTNSVMFEMGLGGGAQPAIAAGAGRLWLTTPYGQGRGQIERVDLATGQLLSTIHLQAGPCTALSFSANHLFANCEAGGRRVTAFWRINPHTQRTARLTGRLHGYIDSMVAVPQALWYVANLGTIKGYTHAQGSPQPLTARVPGYFDYAPAAAGLVYASGSIWALGGGERLARISPYTGKVIRTYTYRDYDPHRAGGLNFLTAGDGWLWFLDNGYPFSGVLRVSMATGRPAGGVPIPANSCGQQVCSQIYFTPGTVWVPTAELLLRIDASRLPG